MTTYEKIVKGATKLKLAAPKTKYIEPILIVTHSARDTHDEDFKVIMRTLATRLQDSAWTVVFKACLVLHIMVREGEGDLALQYLSRQYKILDCPNVSRGTSAGSGTDLRSLKAYAKYLIVRSKEYGATGVDYVRDERMHNVASKNPESGGRLRRLSVQKGVLREVESVQRQIAALLRCKFQESEVNNDVTLTAFRMLVHDLLSLYQSLNEGVINLLEHYFEMSKVDAERALDIYKAFVDQTKDVVAYLRVAKRLEYATKLHVPTIKHAPTALASSLEEYLKDPNFEVNRNQYLAEKEGKAMGKTGSSANLIRESAQANGGVANAGVVPAAVQQQQQQQAIPAQFTQVQSPLVFQQQTGFNPWNFPSSSSPFAAQQQAVAPLFTQIPQQPTVQPQQNVFSVQVSAHQPQQHQPQQHQPQQQQPQQQPQPQPQQPLQTQQTGPPPNMIPIQKTGITVQQTNLVPLQQAATGLTPNGTLAGVQPITQQATGFFSQRPNSTIAPAFTGAGFGGYGSQPVAAQTTGNPFMSAPSNTGTLPAQAAPQPLTAQYTSSRTTMSRSKTNPFALGNIPENGSQQAKESDPTTNPFSNKVASRQTMPLSVMHTGTNPFRTESPAGVTAPLKPQATAGGLENLATVPVFPETQRQFREQQAQAAAAAQLEQQKQALQFQQAQQAQAQLQQQQTGFRPQFTNGGFMPQVIPQQATGNPFQPQQPLHQTFTSSAFAPQQQQQQQFQFTQNNGISYDGPSLI